MMMRECPYSKEWKDEATKNIELGHLEWLPSNQIVLKKKLVVNWFFAYNLLGNYLNMPLRVAPCYPKM
jgi:hypothetical protein